MLYVLCAKKYNVCKKKNQNFNTYLVLMTLTFYQGHRHPHQTFKCVLATFEISYMNTFQTGVFIVI